MTTHTTPSFADAGPQEADALHRLLQAWFRAEGATDPAAILARFDEQFTVVTPAGKLVDYKMFFGGLPASRGSRPTLIMELSLIHI